MNCEKIVYFDTQLKKLSFKNDQGVCVELQIVGQKGRDGARGSNGTMFAGTTNFITKFINPTTIGNSSLFDDGNIGYGTVAPNTVAAFDIVSTTKGMLFPRMTTVQRDAIVVGATEDGLFIFNTTTEKFNFWNDTLGAWESIDTATGGDVSGAGTTNFIPRWTDGPNSVLGDSIIRDNGTVAAVNRAIIATSMFAIQGADAAAVNYSLDVYNSTPIRTFGVRNDGYISAGVALGSITIGLNSGFTPLVADNTVFGVNSFNSASTGTTNTAIGKSVLTANTTGGGNTGVGVAVLFLNTTGNNNTGVGVTALGANTTGSNNTAVGVAALSSGNGSGNTAVGFSAMDQITTGGVNTSIGQGSLGSVSSGSSNVAIGNNSGVFTTTGSLNIFIGASAGTNQTVASNQLFIDNLDRTSAALDLTNSLIFGTFDADPLLQRLRLNMKFIRTDYLPTFANNAAAIVGGLVAGEWYQVVDAATGSEQIQVVQ